MNIQGVYRAHFHTSEALLFMSVCISNPTDAYLFLYNAEMDILRRKVYADVRNIILKHMFVTRSFVFITTSGNRVTIYYCIAFVTRIISHRL